MGYSPPARLRRCPSWTAALVLCCLGASLLPSAQGALIFDRQAILNGQLWRLLSGHLVHFTAGHLWANLLGFALAGGFIERLRPRLLPVLIVCSALFISLAMVWLLPEMATFGGLSGIAAAEFAALAVIGFTQGGAWRRVGGAILVVLTAKVVLEAAGGSSLLALCGNPPFVPVPLAHAVGALVGLTAGLSVAKKRDPASRCEGIGLSSS